MSTRRNAYEVRCPACGSPPAMKCETVVKLPNLPQVMTRPHRVRWIAARQADNKELEKTQQKLEM